MALRLRGSRSKSTSDILDEVVHGEETLRGNSIRIENRYRTYTYEDLEEKKDRFTNVTSREREKEHSTPKSHNFVKKLIASLEKKNEACKADDEFLTRYYKRNDYSNPNSDYSYNEIQQRCSGETGTSENKLSNSSEQKNRGNPEPDKKDRHCKANVFPKNGTPVYSTDQFLLDNYDRYHNEKEAVFGCSNKEENNRKIMERRSKKYCNESPVESELQSDFDVNYNDKKQRQNDSSSFHPHRSRVELENRVGSVNSCCLNRNKDNQKRSTLERILTNSGEEENSKSGASKKKVSRKKSFKGLLESMIKWKKSGDKERPRRYMSCDQLLEEPEAFGAKNNKKLSRAASFQAMVFKDYVEEDSTDISERKATIRPIYGGKRNEHRLVDSAKKKENRKFVVVEENVDDLVRPSAIRVIAKHLTQHPQKSRNNNSNKQARQSLVERNY